MDVGCLKRRHCCFNDVAETHTGVVISGLCDRRNGESHFHSEVGLSHRRAEELVFRSEETAGVDFRSCNVGVNINTTGHDGLSGCVNDFCISADGVDNLAVLDADIHLLCVNSLSRVDYGTILDDILGHS